MHYYLIEARAPLYSVKVVDVYQVASAYPLPTPHAVVGALGAAMAHAGMCRGSRCMKEAEGLVVAARPAAVGELAKFPAVLWRTRGVLEDKSLPAGLEDYAGARDAMVREYAYAYAVKILLVTRERVPQHVIRLVARLGDSESYTSVVDVLEGRPRECGGLVNVAVRAAKARRGSYTLYRALDERGNRELFAYPVVEEGGVYKRGGVEVGSKVLCLGEAVFPEGDGW